jgi:two-component system, chemotaxis family, protein-glutamate methylesterase/glutaminase
VGASAGGVEALSQLVHHLPGNLAASVFVVLRMPAHATSLLPHILSRNGPLPAAHPFDSEEIRPGRISIAPPDHHLLLHGGRIRLSRGPRENGHRPAVDPLFRTAARSYGRRVVGVIFSGTLDDGTAGLSAIKQRGGVTVVQAPGEALYPGMPHSALASVEVDHCSSVAEIGKMLASLARDPVSDPGGEPMPEDIAMESEIAAFDLDAIQSGRRPGTPSGFGCPDCGGSLRELHDGELIRFRCRVGHAWTTNSLLARQSEGLETALWTALRALEERAVLCNRVAERLRNRGTVTAARRFQEQSQDARRRAAILREVLVSSRATNAEPGAAEPDQAEPGAVAEPERTEPNG